MTIETGSGSGAATRAGTQMLDALNDLLQLDHDAIGAYEIAMERLENREQAAQVEEFRRDHEGHVRDLSLLIQGLGGTPMNEPHASGPFKQALQGLGALGGDRGTLMAFRTNELRVRAKYRACAARASGWPVEVRTTVQRSALDEERHYRWVVEALDGMESPAKAAARAAHRLADGAGTIVEARVETTPIPALGLSFAAGFVVGRILR